MSNELIINSTNSELNNTYNNNNITNNSESTNSSKLLEINLLLDRSYLIKMVDINHSKLTFVPQVGKSKAWTRFERIYYENCKTVYVKCKYCDDIIKHVRPFGTGGLLRHKCLNYCKKRKGTDAQKKLFLTQETEDKTNKLINYTLNNQQMISSNTNNAFHNSSDNGFQLKAGFMVDRNFLVNLVKTGDQRLSFVDQLGKSCVWDRFQRIYYDNCETVYVKCRFCDDIQKHARNFGTGSLLRHNCCQQCKHKRV